MEIGETRADAPMSTKIILIIIATPSAQIWFCFLILQYKYKVIRGGYRRDFTLAVRNALKTTIEIDMKVGPKNRWYDTFPDLRSLVEELKDLKKQERDKIILGMKDLIMDYDDELIDRYVFKFPMSLRRRWYDISPFSWLVINALEYANKDLITDVILYLKEKL